MLSVPMNGTKNRTVGRMGNFRFKTMYCMEYKICHYLLALEGSSEAYNILFHQLEAMKPDQLGERICGALSSDRKNRTKQLLVFCIMYHLQKHG